MKRISTILVVAMILAVSVPALAKKSVDIQGNLERDGYLMIDIDWTVDTKRYRNVTPEVRKETVRKEIYNKVVSQLERKTKGLHVSFDKSNFTILKENVTLAKERTDGTQVLDVDVTVRFNAPCQAAAPGRTTSSRKATRENEGYLYNKWNDSFGAI